MFLQVSMSRSDYPPGYDPSLAPLYGPQGGGGYPPPPAYGFPGFGGPPQGHPSVPYGAAPNAPPYSGQPGGYPPGGYPPGGYPPGGYPPGPKAGQPHPGAGYGYPNQPPMPPMPPMMPPTMPSDVFSSGRTCGRGDDPLPATCVPCDVFLFVCLFVCLGAKGRGQDTAAAMGVSVPADRRSV